MTNLLQLPECSNYNKLPFFFLKIYYLSSIQCFVACMSEHQKWSLDLITDGCEPPCGYWELNSESLEEQPVLLTTEPSLQP
ncbi:hypothetical protein ACRRTK_017326 [Alexandromys fortis]